MSESPIHTEVTKAAIEIGAKLVEGSISVGSAELRSRINAVRVALGEGFAKYISYLNEKCGNVRTIVHPQETISLNSIYTPLTYTTSRRRYSDEQVIAALAQRKRILLLGTAGGGKSIYMKWVALNLSRDFRSRLPIFYELRNLNKSGGKTIIEGIVSVLRTRINSLDETIFAGLLENDKVILILDSFDEIDYDLRERYALDLEQIAERYPKIRLIVSSRPERDITSIVPFSVFTVKPMSCEETCNLLSKIDYDPEVRDSFIERVKSELYEKHETFLSNPLLSSMMLMTFSQRSDVPERMHLFYQQAFEVLFERHDRSKGVYTRKLLSGLDVREFQAVFAQFCASSYVEEDFSFGDNSVNQYAYDALAYENRDVKSSDYVRDLTEAVCLLQRDGPEYSFVHRSFQEYFTSVFINSMQPTDYKEAVDSLLKRSSGDSVVSMLIDRDRDRFDRLWLITTIDDILSEELTPAAFARKIYDGIWCENKGRSAFILADVFEANRYFIASRFGGINSQLEAMPWNPILNLDAAFSERSLASRLKGTMKKTDIDRLRKAAEAKTTVFNIKNYPDIVINEIIADSALNNYVSRFREMRAAAESRLQQKSIAARNVFRKRRNDG